MTGHTADPNTDSTDFKMQLDAWLEQAEAFARNGDYLGAHARARHAQEEVERRVPCDSELGDELRALVELALRHYDGLVTSWQMQNVTRHAAFVARERAALAADQPDQPGAASLARRLRYRRWRTALANGFKAPSPGTRAPRPASHV